MQPYHSYLITLIDAQSMGADITSSAHNVDEVISYAVQANWSGGGTPVGNFIIQASNDGVNFVDVSTTAVSGDSGSLLVNVTGHAYMYIRLFYDRTSGTATLSANINGKKG